MLEIEEVGKTPTTTALCRRKIQQSCPVHAYTAENNLVHETGQTILPSNGLFETKTSGNFSKHYPSMGCKQKADRMCMLTSIDLQVGLHFSILCSRVCTA